MTDTDELDAEVLRAVRYVNHTVGANIPTSPIIIAALRAALHGGNFYLAKLPDYIIHELTQEQIDVGDYS